MQLCSDPALNYLTGVGYNVVRLPSTKLRPLDVIGKDARSTEWLGSIATLCASPSPLPEYAQNPSSAIRAITSGKLRTKTGLGVLGGLLSSFGVDVAALEAAYSKATHLQFTFRTPVIRSVSPGAAGEWLCGAEPNHKNPIVRRYFGSEEGAACIVTETLTSKSFSVTAFDKRQRSAHVGIPAIHSAPEGSLQINQSIDRVGELEYVGSELLTFGFKAFALEHSFGLWVISGITDGQLMLGGRSAKAVSEPAGHIFANGWLELTDAAELGR